ncbi:MAG: glycosyl hydrolase family 53 [Butyrivibrio sp.]|nr:glycosyl hydrolase family 53 [Butyrivibrio sp.]
MKKKGLERLIAIAALSAMVASNVAGCTGSGSSERENTSAVEDNVTEEQDGLLEDIDSADDKGDNSESEILEDEQIESSSGGELEASADQEEVSDDQEQASNEPEEAAEPDTSWKETAPKAGVTVEPVKNLSEEFALGMDASSVLVEENSGVKYYDFDGNEADPFKTMAEAGINYIRLRVWNDPYDENGNGYGGGNNDLPTTIELGKRATEYGMKVCIDFHYSDFWADPKRQHEPKAWAGMNIDSKCDALYEYTVDSLTQILDAGIDVGMVQIGNEINNGMAGVSMIPYVTRLLEAGSKGVRETSEKYGKDIKIIVHYANIDNFANLESKVNNLEKAELDYDILGMSYYPFWDSDLEKMGEIIKTFKEKYDKEFIIAETSYCYTSEDGDGAGNSVNGTDDIVDGYPATVQGQTNMVRDVINMANEAGATGVFYWEGTWIPVGPADADNSAIWEEFGSGWASSYAGDYDPEDAGLYYGGCSWDNQAFFDFDGKPLESLNVYKYIRSGALAELSIDAIPDTEIELAVGAEPVLPDEIDVIYNDKTANSKAKVTWDEADVAKIDTSKENMIDVNGTLEDGQEVTCHVKVLADNYVLNPSFEDSDRSMWKITANGGNPTDYQEKDDDAHTGDFALHFWSESKMDFTLEQEITDLEPGTYKLMAFAQGGDMSPSSELTLFAKTAEEEKTEGFMVTSWADWQNPTIPEIEVTDGTVTIGVHMVCNPKSWGTVDDFTLIKVD